MFRCFYGHVALSDQFENFYIFHILLYHVVWDPGLALDLVSTSKGFGLVSILRHSGLGFDLISA